MLFFLGLLVGLAAGYFGRPLIDRVLARIKAARSE